MEWEKKTVEWEKKTYEVCFNMYLKCFIMARLLKRRIRAALSFLRILTGGLKVRARFFEGMALTNEQKRFIREKVKQLGSLDNAKRFYKRKSLVTEYALKVAGRRCRHG